MSEWAFGLAEPADAEVFSAGVLGNPQVDPQDMLAGQGKKNPTVLTFVVKKDGVAVAFAPVYLAAVLAHLSLNPDTRASEKIQALEMLRDGVMAFMVQFGIREIQTLSKPEYGVAKWAVDHGFEQDGRSLFRLDLNKEMTEAK